VACDLRLRDHLLKIIELGLILLELGEREQQMTTNEKNEG